jgi:predicted peroxiredoxin
MEQRELAILFTVDPREDIERASMGMSVANAALATDVRVKVFFACGGINMLRRGYVAGLEAPHFAGLQELLDLFIEEGGEVFACSPFLHGRNIPEADLIDGVTLSSAPTLVHDARNGVITI